MSGLGNLANIDTKWSAVFYLNAIVYTVLFVSTLCLIGSAFCWPLAVCGCCCFCLSSIGHLVAIIVTGIMRYGSDGEYCATVNVAINTNGDTYKDIGAAMEGMFISQCVLYCFYGCCMGILLQMAVGIAVIKKNG